MGPAPTDAPPEHSTFSCQLEDDRLVDCHIPTGRWDLRLTADHFTPILLWNVRADLDDGPDLDLGTLRFEHGGSVFGTVVTETGDLDPDRARVAIHPLTDFVEPAARERFERLTRVVLPDARGQFQFVGLPPGAYQIKASHPGFVIARHAPIDVRRSQWTELDEPLLLPLPLQLTVQIVPAHGAGGTPWTLRLTRPDGANRRVDVASGRSDAIGWWEPAPLPAGTYDLTVADEAGNVFLERDVVLQEAGQAIEVEIPIVYVEGSVSLGDEPIEATLWFGGRTGTERIKAESDDEGTFDVLLPRDGDWIVDVSATNPPVAARSLVVPVDADSELRFAEVIVSLPETTVRGRVVDGQGRPQSAARIALLPVAEDGRPTTARTDEAGEFVLRGLVPGRYRAEATSSARSSESVEVDLREGSPLVLELVLGDTRTIKGRLSFDGAPVAQAEIGLYPRTRTGQPPSLDFPTTRSALDGTFRVDAPSAPEYGVIVRARGFPLTVLTHSVDGGDRLDIGLEPNAGTVVLGGAHSLARPSEGLVTFLMVDGLPVDLPTLFAWARSQSAASNSGDSLRVPGMPLGSYAFCRARMQEVLAILDGAAVPRSEACSSGHLVSGELVLAPVLTGQ